MELVDYNGGSVFDDVGGVTPIEDSGHWFMCEGEWKEIIGNFIYDEQLPMFNVYYREPGNLGYAINRCACTKGTFEYCNEEVMQRDRPEYLI